MTEPSNNPYSAPIVPQEAAAVLPATSPEVDLTPALQALKDAGDNGANWFFWIAGLSLVNTAVCHMGGEIHFIIGLGVTFIADIIAAGIGKQNPELNGVAVAVAVGFSIVISAVSCVFGWLSRKRMLWIFGIGMFIYLLDGILYLLIGDFLPAAFHGYALYSMGQGFSAYRKLNEVDRAMHEMQHHR